MDNTMRIMSKKPLNAETPITSLKSWVTANKVFFDRNQGDIPEKCIDLEEWKLAIEGEVRNPLELDFATLLKMPKAIAANTLECSGNSRSLFKEKSYGNPWTIGGVGNAVWGGVWLKDVLAMAGVKESAQHVAFGGFDQPLGKAQIPFVRSIPLEKALTSTLLVYEMNGEPLPIKHGYPLRGLALGWTGASSVKWLNRITVLEKQYEGFFMDKVYRVFDKGEDSKKGEVVKEIQLKSIIFQPQIGEKLDPGEIPILGAAYAGEKDIAKVEISVDGGSTWRQADFIGPHEAYAWRHWQYVWKVKDLGEYTILSRATDTKGEQQPMQASWNKLGYGNNGVLEHGVAVTVE